MDLEVSFNVAAAEDFPERLRNDFRVAVIGNDLKTVSGILDMHPALIDIIGDSGMTALMAAVFFQKQQMVQLLLNRGASVDLKDNSYGTTSLMLAASLGNEEIARALLERGADPNIQERHDCLTALMIAAREGHVAIADLLLDWGADLDRKSRNSGTAVFIARDRHRTEMEEFLRKEMSPEKREQRQQAPFLRDTNCSRGLVRPMVVPRKLLPVKKGM